MYSFILVHFKKHYFKIELKKSQKQKYLTHSEIDIVGQNVENSAQSIFRLTVEYSKCNLSYFDRVEDIQVM